MISWLVICLAMKGNGIDSRPERRISPLILKRIKWNSLDDAYPPLQRLTKLRNNNYERAAAVTKETIYLNSFNSLRPPKSWNWKAYQIIRCFIKPQSNWNIIPVRSPGFSSLRVWDVYKMYTINFRWVDDKRVTTLVKERVPATTSAVFPPCTLLMSDKIFISSWKKNCPLACTHVCARAYVFTYACGACFPLRFISLFSRSSCRG